MARNASPFGSCMPEGGNFRTAAQPSVLQFAGPRPPGVPLRSLTTQVLRYEVPNTIPKMAYGALHHHIWVLRPSGGNCRQAKAYTLRSAQIE